MPESNGKFWGALLGAAIASAAASGGFSSLQLQDVQDKAAASEAQFAKLYDQSVRPVMEGLIQDAEDCKEAFDELEEHHDKILRLEATVRVLRDMTGRRRTAERLTDKEVDRLRQTTETHAYPDESLAAKALQSVRSRARKKPVAKNALPSFSDF